MGGGSSTEGNCCGSRPRPYNVLVDDDAFVAPKKGIVDTLQLAKKGTSIQASGRYCKNQPISADYEMESKVLGSGMSGPVRLAINRADGRKYAVKSFNKQNVDPKMFSMLKDEVEIHLSLDHPHIVNLEMVYETETSLSLVMELMTGGELYDRIVEKHKYSEQEAASTTHQILFPMAYMHAHGLTHRDVKPENFMYETAESDILKMIDFGFAKFRERNTKLHEALGTVHYVAPEVLAKSYTEKADCWSLGIIVYMLLVGGHPIPHQSSSDLISSIMEHKIRFSSRFYQLPDVAQDFVKRLLTFDPEKRMSAEKALEHRFVRAVDGQHEVHKLDSESLSEMRSFAHASHFKRATYAMMAWSLTTEQRAVLGDEFLSVDVESTGTITHTQFKQIVIDKFHIDNAEVEKLFESLDTNSDGEIAYSEFLAGMVHDRLSMHADVLHRTFTRFDFDHNGTISKDDLINVFGSSFDGKELDELFQAVDVDKDGGISYEEFLQYFQHENTMNEENYKLTENLSNGLDKLLVAPLESPHAFDPPVMMLSKQES